MRFTKKLLAVALVFMLVLSLVPAVSFANSEITVTIDGQQVTFADQGPVIIDGRTLVPVGGVFGVIDFVPTWDGATRTATLTRSDFTIVITIASATFTTNGVEHTLDVPAQIVNGRTMLPIRAVLESIGYELDWDSTTRTVVIETSTPATAPPASLPITEPTTEPSDENDNTQGAEYDATEPANGEPDDDEPEEEGTESDFLTFFDLNQVREMIEYYGSDIDVPDDHVFFQPSWVMGEHSFTFHDDTVIRWQFIHIDGFDPRRFDDIHDLGYIFGSRQWSFFLVILRDGRTFIYVDVGNAYELIDPAQRPEWLTPYYRAYYVISLD